MLGNVQVDVPDKITEQYEKKIVIKKTKIYSYLL